MIGQIRRLARGRHRVGRVSEQHKLRAGLAERVAVQIHPSEGEAETGAGESDPLADHRRVGPLPAEAVAEARVVLAPAPGVPQECEGPRPALRTGGRRFAALTT